MLDGSKGYIIVDGHICDSVRGDIYKVTDDYIVNVKEWQKDNRNRDLHVIISLFNADGFGNIEYVTTGPRSKLNELMNEVSGNYKSDLLLTYAMFASDVFSGSLPMLTAIAVEG